MSNNLVSEQYPIPSLQVGQLESVLNKMDSSMPEMSTGIMGSVGYMSQQFPISNKQTPLISENPSSHGFPSAEMQMGQKSINTLQSQNLLSSYNQTGQTGLMEDNFEHIPSLKRKAPVELLSENSAPENMLILQKQMAQTHNRPWLQQMSAKNKRVVQLESLPNSLPSNKKLAKTDSFSNKTGSQRASNQKSQSARSQPPKTLKDSSDSVRSKMREQLAAALSLVIEQQEIKPSEIGNNGSGESVTSDTVDVATKEGNNSMDNTRDGQTEFAKVLPDVGTGNSASVCEGREFQPSTDLSYEDVPFSDNFYVKDELLQGNGLSWVLEADLEMVDKMGMQIPEEPGLNYEKSNGDKMKKTFNQPPEDVALEIEEELFKLFGGVNKKYKEKGRSLLFNLKDRNNPELRERVMAGAISPERLCSMTAEELASKELSEWRMAKAEELAQMVVLPDTEVDIRRLVRKTHKGEFQVEVEQDDILPMDTSGGLSSDSQTRPKNRMPEIPTLTIPSHEGSDLMQGLMVDDELKDVDFLHPIVSLDEFMKSLDNEPPFEILPLDSDRVETFTDKDEPVLASTTRSSDQPSKATVSDSSEKGDTDKIHANADASVSKSDDRLDSKPISSSADLKSRASIMEARSKGSHRETEVSQPKGLRVWGGSLQLSISSTADVVGFFKSGEKASASEWPGSIEIKGRVRLDAFEKFLQQLPLSRSRAVMVVHFLLKDGSSESELAAMKEVSESYVADERVGFAEPGSGVELYFCPPHNDTLELLGKVISKEHVDALKSIDNGLIGVTVWRKLSLISPKSSSSHHKHASKKHLFTTPRRHNDPTPTPDFAPKPALRRDPPPVDEAGDEDDVPPGFGPPATRDDDDLPEFSFSGGQQPSASGPKFFGGAGLPPRPVDQVREMIHKYGQSNAPASRVQNWNDDDDDIPEWQPQPPPQQILRPHYASQPPLPRPPVQSVNGLENPAAWQQSPPGSWWAPSPGQASNLNQYRAPGQQGSGWEHNMPKSRGF